MLFNLSCFDFHKSRLELSYLRLALMAFRSLFCSLRSFLMSLSSFSKSLPSRLSLILSPFTVSAMFPPPMHKKTHQI